MLTDVKAFVNEISFVNIIDFPSCILKDCLNSQFIIHSCWLRKVNVRELFMTLKCKKLTP